ncbi:dihydrolipoyl dehydrogenase family protein [Henriciella aquimarina]|uniref:dihydrolipoyl dehydrogenase family protein n=1 Tax=Henriciella aquimarina TaxID=545261 RepID=UPI000A04841B|nr:FAD-dependent oxidoreductase [Henriciella aquimarina]
MTEEYTTDTTPPDLADETSVPDGSASRQQPRMMKADLVVIGAGSAGLSAAAGAAMLGLDVVLFEKGEMGGDCLNTGCVPSKALLTAAKYAAAARESEAYGVTSGEPKTNWTKVQAHIRKAIDTIAPVDSQERFEGLGVTVIREHAHFTNPRTVASDSVIVSAKRVAIATGSKAAIPPVPGIETVDYLTNETIFDLPELPDHLVILGAGPIGMEMAQAFRRLGSNVTVIEMGRALARSDESHAAIAARALKQEGVTLLDHHKAAGISTEGGLICVEAEGPDGTQTVRGTHLLVAAGRTPLTDGLALDAGEVDHDQYGIKVSDKLRSISNKHVWALGDVAGKGQFTHLAGWHASVLVRRAFFKQGSTSSSLPLPSVTYTSPEVAQVGLTEQEARDKHGEKVQVTRFGFDENDRAIAEGKTDGECKLILHKGKLVGASIVGEGAGDIIQLVGYAMSNGMKLTSLTNFISPYPTRTEVVKRAASAHFSDAVFGKPAKMLVSLLQRIL